ncbi:MAG: hypothetical protein SGJ00_10875 [bacterium]|nr:hypothetical protein [bacterium]
MAIDAIRERETIANLSTKYELLPTMISIWKQEFIDLAKQVFAKKQPTEEPSEDVDLLYSKIGKLEMENDVFKKNFKESRTLTDNKSL